MRKSVRLTRPGVTSVTSTLGAERPPDCSGTTAHNRLRAPKTRKNGVGTLKSSLEREHALVREKDDLLRQSELLRAETSHRVLNDLQLVSSLLSLQSKSASCPEAAFELRTAAERVAVIGRIHRQMRLLEGREIIDFRACLEELCHDLSGIFALGGPRRSLVLEAIDLRLPASMGLPLLCIVNELITNAAKHGAGRIVVRARRCVDGYELSVTDNGPGLPKEFDPANRKGLGMKIVRSLIDRVGGRFEWGAGEGHRGARVSVMFPARSANEHASKAP